MKQLLVLLAFLFACSGGGTAEPWSDEWILDETDAYLEDAEFRRAAMLESLRNHDNLYSGQRVASYGLDTRGWDALPEWNPRSRTVDAALADAIVRNEVALPEGTDGLWNGERPATMGEWIALGREVFFRYPLRSDPYVRWGIANPSVSDPLGLLRHDGSYPGVVVFRDVDGAESVGITCALCHTAVRGGDLRLGVARRGFDYGELRARFHEETGAPVDPELLRRMQTWGPGRADITEDDGEDPVAIPDLFGLRYQSALTQAGTIVHLRPSALAIRQETQLLHANHQRARPPRELSWALAMFLYSLEPEPPSISDAAAVERGRRHFERGCTGCHDNTAYGGDVVDAAFVGTDLALANGAARGTGFYRPPALLGVRDAAPFFHDGSVPTLDDLFSVERFEETYDRRPHGEGAAPGHRFGVELEPEEKTDLVTFLRSL